MVSEFHTQTHASLLVGLIDIANLFEKERENIQAAILRAPAATYTHAEFASFSFSLLQRDRKSMQAVLRRQPAALQGQDG